MACKTMRTWARAVKGIKHPEMIVPVSAHAAFDKAGEYFGIKIHKVGVDLVTRKAKVKDMERAINGNTIVSGRARRRNPGNRGMGGERRSLKQEF